MYARFTSPIAMCFSSWRHWHVWPFQSLTCLTFSKWMRAMPSRGEANCNWWGETGLQQELKLKCCSKSRHVLSSSWSMSVVALCALPLSVSHCARMLITSEKTMGTLRAPSQSIVYIYVYIYICVYVCVCVYIYILYLYIWIYLYLLLYIYVYMYIFKSAQTYRLGHTCGASIKM